MTTILPYLILALALGIFAAADRLGFRFLFGALHAAQDAFTTVRQVDTLTVTASTTGSGAKFNIAGKRRCVWFALCTAAAGGVSVVVAAQLSVDGGTTWITQDSFAAITATGLTRKDPSAETGPDMRFFWTESGGGTGTVKMYVAYIEPSVFVDRS